MQEKENRACIYIHIDTQMLNSIILFYLLKVENNIFNKYIV